MSTHTINPELCTACGLCVAACSCMIYELADDRASVRNATVSLCVRCGHCMAICPPRAITIQGLDPDGFVDSERPVASAEALEALLRRRRSTRVFRDKPVSRELLQRLVDAAATAPMGFPPSRVEVSVVAEREQVAATARAALQRDQELRHLYGIPEDNEVLNVLAVGYPAHRFRRSIPRSLKAVHWVAPGPGE